MAYYLDLFSPDTYEAFSHSDQTVSGFRQRQRKAASCIQVGDKLICYMTKLSQWIGILEVTSEAYEDFMPLFLPEDDPFVVRFNVKSLVWLQKEYAVPIRFDEVWNELSFTKDYDKKTSFWTGRLRSSLVQMSEKDGKFLESLLINQVTNKFIFDVDEDEYARLISHTVRRADKVVSVAIPESDADEAQPAQEVRESIKIQALLARIGAKMGLRIWIPRRDRSNVFVEWKDHETAVLGALPLNYDELTIKTIEEIDVIWLRGRSIVRAFEVEHTTSIYSGILRMADLLALQPNMDIKLHIVAPIERKDRVFQEIRRPVFSLLEKGPLSDNCTFLSYDSLQELAKQKHLAYMTDDVLDEYVEEAE